MFNRENDKWSEDEFYKIHEEIKAEDFLNLLDFLKIRNFKLQLTTHAKESEVIEKTRLAFSYAEENNFEKAIKILSDDWPHGLHGVGIPIASAILAIRYPEKFAIIDKNTIKGLCSKNLISKEDENNWLANYTKDVSLYCKYNELLKNELLKNKKDNQSLRNFELELFDLGRKKMSLMTKFKKKQIKIMP